MYHKWQSYDVWVLRYWVWLTEFFVILDRFLPCTPPSNNPKNKTFEKIKKKRRRYHHFTQMYQKSWSYATLFLRSIQCMTDVIRIFHFGIMFCPFTPLTTPKIKIFKKWNSSLQISSFYTCIPKIMVTWCMVPEIWCATNAKTDI